MYKIIFIRIRQLLMAVEKSVPLPNDIFSGGLRLFRIDINQRRDAAPFRNVSSPSM